MAHYRELCAAVSRKLSIKRLPFMCVKSSPGMTGAAGGGACEQECVCVWGAGEMGKPQVRRRANGEPASQPADHGMTI